MLTHKVQNGDTLYSIARHYRISVQMLAMSNNIFCPYQVFEGKELLIPLIESNRYFKFRNYRLEYALDSIKKIFLQEGTASHGVLKFTFPRYDLNVKIDNITIKPDLALTSWIAFFQIENHNMLMGDLVLMEDEVEPVMSCLFENGIEITALHNHLQREQPRIIYMHIKGEGEPIKLAQGVRNALSKTATPFKFKQQPSSQIDWSLTENILGRKGTHKGKVLQLSFPRSIVISENGYQLPPAMGISHGINFQFVGNKVATTGDFVLLANEVNPVASLLNKNNIAVTAIHNHMLTEVPRLFFMHFWAVDKPEHLAQTFKSVLNLAK